MKKKMIVMVGILCGVGLLFSGCGKKQAGSSNTGKASAENASSTKVNLPKEIVKIEKYTEIPRDEVVPFDPAKARPGTMEYVFWQYMKACNEGDWEKAKTFAAKSCRYDDEKDVTLKDFKDLNKYKYFTIEVLGGDIDPQHFNKKDDTWDISIYAFTEKPKDEDSYYDGYEYGCNIVLRDGKLKVGSQLDKFFK